MTMAEYRAHYSVWAVLASPLILSADLRTINQTHPECLDLMLNREIIAVNQDPASLPPVLVSQATNMGRMFEQATSFNQDISKWVVSQCSNMRAMFQGAAIFNADTFS